MGEGMKFSNRSDYLRAQHAPGSLDVTKVKLSSKDGLVRGPNRKELASMLGFDPEVGDVIDHNGHRYRVARVFPDHVELGHARSDQQPGQGPPRGRRKHEPSKAEAMLARLDRAEEQTRRFAEEQQAESGTASRKMELEARLDDLKGKAGGPGGASPELRAEIEELEAELGSMAEGDVVALQPKLDAKNEPKERRLRLLRNALNPRTAADRMFVDDKRNRGLIPNDRHEIQAEIEKLEKELDVAARAKQGKAP
jgi:hypothetical protein